MSDFRFRVGLLNLLLLAAGCPTPTHATPTYEGEAPARVEPTTGEEQARPSRVVRGAVDQPFLYAVRNVEQPSYLLGTIHVGVSLAEALPGTHFDTLAAPRAILVEMDPATVTSQRMADGARLRRGSLQDMLDSLIWHDLTEELANTMAAQGLRQMRPWFAMMMLTQHRIAEMHEGSPPEAMDLSIVNYARDQNITLVPLESASAQIDALNAVPNEQMVRIITEMVRDPDAASNELTEMLDAYRGGDENRMTRLIFDPEDLSAMPEMYDSLFTRRNAAWLPRIKSELDEGGAFIAVGLGHLLSEGGLLAQLREAGYPIERVR